MAAWSDVLVVLGPLADIVPREAAVLAFGFGAALAVSLCIMLARSRRPLLFAASWSAAVALLVAVQAGLASLEAYGSPAHQAGGAEPLSVAGVEQLVRSDWRSIAGAVLAGVAVATILAWRRPGDASALAILTEDDRPSMD